MTDDDRPDWRKRTDATLREFEALEQTLAEQVARVRLIDKDIMTMDLGELRARVLVMETQSPRRPGISAASASASTNSARAKAMLLLSQRLLERLLQGSTNGCEG